MGFLEDGVVDLAEIQQPDKKRFNQGPVVVIECVQKIPCNPCVESCPQEAITIQPTVNDMPRVDFEKCTGCASCIAHCPGLAIFVVNRAFDKKRSLISMPYEFIPLPSIGETVDVFDRSGQRCGEGEIIRIRNAPSQDRTPVVSVAVEQSLAMTARHFKRKSHAQ